MRWRVISASRSSIWFSRAEPVGAGDTRSAASNNGHQIDTPSKFGQELTFRRAAR
jgi:hypothetical protein